jgi:hypothetical protein
LRSIKGLNSLSVIVVGSSIQVFLVENDILYGLACRLPGFLEKGRDTAEHVLKREASGRKEVREQAEL